MPIIPFNGSECQLSGAGVTLAAGCRWYPQANWEADNTLPIKEAATALGLSPRQIYRRGSSLRPLPCLAFVIGCTGSGVGPPVQG